jgi:DNA-directed RNA polymerase specialized sigma24 family protein
VQHANARLTVHARKLLVQRVAAGWPQARVAEQLGVSRQTVAKWWARGLVLWPRDRTDDAEDDE